MAKKENPEFLLKARTYWEIYFQRVPYFTIFILNLNYISYVRIAHNCYAYDMAFNCCEFLFTFDLAKTKFDRHAI